MKETIGNLKATFADSRNILKGMSEDFYLMTEYISENINDNLNSGGIVMTAIGLMDDLQKGTNGFGGEFPEKVAKRKDFMVQEIQWIPQFIDLIAEKDFADEVRKTWEEVFGYKPPKKVQTDVIKTIWDYPENVTVAVDWWANAITAPKFDNGEAMPFFMAMLIAGSVKEYTPEQIRLFKETLAEGIMEQLKEYGRCRIEVDYNPCRILYEAGRKIGVPDMIGYPCKTSMYVEENKVEVSAGYGAGWETLWTQE